MSPVEATKELEQLDGTNFENFDTMSAASMKKQALKDKFREKKKKTSMKTKKTQQEITAKQMSMLNGLDAKFKEKKVDEKK